MPAENILTLANSVVGDDSIRVVTEGGLSQRITVTNLKNSLTINTLTSDVATLKTKATSNDTAHTEMTDRIEDLELKVGVDGAKPTGIFQKLKTAESNLATQHLSDFNSLTGQLSTLRSDLTLVDGTNGRLDVLEDGVAGLASTKLDVLAFQNAVAAGFKVIKKTPTSATYTGTAGEVCWDDTYFYVCIANNTWKRIPFPDWT